MNKSGLVLSPRYALRYEQDAFHSAVLTSVLMIHFQRDYLFCVGRR